MTPNRYGFLSDYDEGDIPVETVLEACKRARKEVAERRRTVAHPATGEKIPAIRLGVYLASRIRRRNTDPEPALQQPVGGYVITDGDDCWEVVDIWRGQPQYTVIDAEELDWDAYDGLINVRSLRSVSRTINQQMALSVNPDRRHLHALLALSNAIENR